MTAGYQALLAACKGNATWSGLVKRINDWSVPAAKTLPQLQPADLPEFSFVMGGFTLKPYGRNSLVSEIMQAYTLVAVTDTLLVTTVNAVNYATLAALNRADLENATWNGQRFIEDFVVNPGSDGTTGVTLPGLSGSAVRGVDRNVSICSVTLSLYVARASLPA